MRLWRSGVSCDSAVARPLGRWCGAKWRQRSDKVLDHMRTCASTQHLPGRSSSSVGSRGATTAPSPALQAPPRHAMCTTYTRKYTNIYVIRFGIRPPPPRPGAPPPAETQTARRAPPRRRGRACLQYIWCVPSTSREPSEDTRPHRDRRDAATRGRGVASGASRARRAAAPRGTRRNTRRAAPPWRCDGARSRWRMPYTRPPLRRPTSHVPPTRWGARASGSAGGGAPKCATIMPYK